MCVGLVVKQQFEKRLTLVLGLIKQYNISFDEVGIFGSYARNDYKASSDIDFCIVTKSKPSHEISGSLREEADLLGADIIYVTPEYLKESTSEFAKQLRRDYRRVL